MSEQEKEKLDQRQIDIEEDYELGRRTYKMILASYNKAIPLLSEVTETSEHPKSFEALSKMLKEAAEVADKLIEHQRKKQVVDAESAMDLMRITDESGVPILEATVVKEEVFTGSSADLQRQLSEKKKKENADV